MLNEKSISLQPDNSLGGHQLVWIVDRQSDKIQSKCEAKVDKMCAFERWLIKDRSIVHFLIDKYLGEGGEMRGGNK
jgi:hypothetical protein